MLDDFSPAIWIFLMYEKSEVYSILPRFCQNVHSQFHKKNKSVRTDNGSELIALKTHFIDH